MHSTVDVMNVEVNMVSKDDLTKKLNAYLKEEELNSILFASASLVKAASEDTELHEEIKRWDMLLPGEESLLSMYHADVLEAGNMVVNCKAFGDVLENLKKQDATVYIVSGSEDRAICFEAFCHAMQPELQILGVCQFDENADALQVINEINGKTPDLLLLDLDEMEQIKWLQEYKKTVNARLCIAIGGVSMQILSEYKEYPNWVKNFHLENLYTKLFERKK